MLRMRSQPVPRAARVFDVVGLLIFIAGAGAYVWSWFGLRELRERQPSAASPPFENLVRFDELWRLSRWGIGLMIGGFVVVVLGSLLAYLLVKRRADSNQPLP